MNRHPKKRKSQDYTIQETPRRPHETDEFRKVYTELLRDSGTRNPNRFDQDPPNIYGMFDAA